MGAAVAESPPHMANSAILPHSFAVERTGHRQVPVRSTAHKTTRAVEHAAGRLAPVGEHVRQVLAPLRLDN